MSACPACGGPLAPWRTVPSSERLTRAAFELARCGWCGTAVTLGGPPADLHVTGAYGPRAPRLAGLAAPVLRTFDRRRLALLARAAPPPARLLDAGAGRGRFVAAARAAGYDARGIEPSLREPVASLEPTTIENAAVEPGSLDAVTLWHVLEHLDDPGAAVERIAGWLAPGGALLVGVPNLDSAQARMAGARWYHLDVPRHRTHFTPAGLDALLRARGLAPLATTHLLLEHNPFGMWQSWVNLLTDTPSYLYNLLKRNASARSRDLAITLGMLPLAPLASLAEALAGAAHRGGTIAVLARREHRPEGTAPL